MHKIVVAEDEITSRTIISSAVEAEGCVAIQCSNGQIALDMVSDNPDIAMLITDMMMPGLDGRGLIERIRSNPKIANMPVIIVSGVVSIKQIDDILKVGATRFHPKPINIEELKADIRKLLAKLAG